MNFDEDGTAPLNLAMDHGGAGQQFQMVYQNPIPVFGGRQLAAIQGTHLVTAAAVAQQQLLLQQQAAAAAFGLGNQYAIPQQPIAGQSYPVAVPIQRHFHTDQSVLPRSLTGATRSSFCAAVPLPTSGQLFSQTLNSTPSTSTYYGQLPSFSSVLPHSQSLTSANANIVTFCQPLPIQGSVYSGATQPMSYQPNSRQSCIVWAAYSKQLRDTLQVCPNPVFTSLAQAAFTQQPQFFGYAQQPLGNGLAARQIPV